MILAVTVIDFGAYAQAHELRDDGRTAGGWWQRRALWGERVLGDSVERPVEDAALLNIYLEARALEHLDDYALTLTATEYRVLELERTCRRRNTLLQGWSLYAWIAAEMPGFAGEWTARRVKAVLDDATDVIRTAELENVVAEIEKAARERDRVYRKIVREVMTEEAADEWTRAA